MTRDGVWEHWFGMWFSSFILLPIGVFLTHKAMNDSVIMNADTYREFFKKLFFVRDKRKYPLKSVIIDRPDYSEIVDSLSGLSEDIDRYLATYSRVSYKAYWIKNGYERELHAIKSSMEIILNQLSNSRRLEKLSLAEAFPVLITAIRPFKANSILAKISMYLFPVGIILRLLSVPFETRNRNDLKEIQRLSREMIGVIQNAQTTGRVITA